MTSTLPRRRGLQPGRCSRPPRARAGSRCPRSSPRTRPDRAVQTRPRDGTAAPDADSGGQRPFHRSSDACRRFIDGLPMKLATKRLTGWSSRTCGSSVCWSTPLRRTATRSPIVIASTSSCVTSMVVALSSRWFARSRPAFRTRAVRPGSRGARPSGGRSVTHRYARPIATRWRCPPKLTWLPLQELVEPEHTADSVARATSILPLRPSASVGRTRCGRTPTVRIKGGSPGRPSPRPAHGARGRSASGRRSGSPLPDLLEPSDHPEAVVFPQPEGPTKTTNSPSATSRSRLSTARVPSPSTLPTELNVTGAIFLESPRSPHGALSRTRPPARARSPRRSRRPARGSIWSPTARRRAHRAASGVHARRRRAPGDRPWNRRDPSRAGTMSPSLGFSTEAQPSSRSVR